MTVKQRLLLIVPGLLFLVALSAFEFGLRKGRETAPAASPPPAVLSDEKLVATLFAQDLDERVFAFPSVVAAASGREVQPFDPGAEGAAEILDRLGKAADEALLRHNLAESPVRGLARINEASRYFEDTLRALIDRAPDFSCTVPRTAEGHEQRSGYPDLRIEHLPSGRVVYLDPKLFAESSRDSSLRTFYFEPQRGTAKVTEDAHHLLLGIAHDGNSGAWTFLRWELIDLASLPVRLKAEFQASNRDLYGPTNCLATSEDSL